VGGPTVWATYAVKANYTYNVLAAVLRGATAFMSSPKLFCHSDFRPQGTNAGRRSTPAGTAALRLKRVDFISVYVYNNFANNTFTPSIVQFDQRLYKIPAALLAKQPIRMVLRFMTGGANVDANTNATVIFRNWGGFGTQFPNSSLVTLCSMAKPI